MSRHMNKFHLNAGMHPQIPVLMKISDARRMDPRRPRRSASMPQRSEPIVVPISAMSGSMALSFTLMPYSLRMPGNTNPSVAGFMTSTTRATPMHERRAASAPG